MHTSERSRKRPWLRGRLLPVSVILLAGMSGLWAGCGEDGPAEPTAPEVPRPTTVEVSPATVELAALGATAQLMATVMDQNGQAMAGVSVAWSSGDTLVAWVDGSGLVTAVGNGAAAVTATAGSVGGSAAVAVAQRAAEVRVSPDSVTLVARGDTVRLTAEALDANGHAVANAEFAWSSGDTLVAWVDGSGLVTAVGNGAAAVTATAGSVGGSAAVTVAQRTAQVRVSPDSATLVARGDTLRLTAGALDANGHAVADAEFAWSSGDTLVAVVDGSGLVTAVGNGEAAVTATAGSASGSAAVAVEQAVSTVAVSPGTDTLVVRGDTVRLTAEAFDANGHAVVGASFKWESGDTSVATVDASGLVTAMGNGTATITASAGAALGTADVAVGLVGEAPPTWVFAGHVPDIEQNKLREEMEYVRAYFDDEFGVAATGFTVLVGDFAALAPIYRNVVGTDLSKFYLPGAVVSGAWVTSSVHGGAVITFLSGLDDPFSHHQRHIAHEYFHVLQGQLASGFAPLQNGEIAWHTSVTDVAPTWLVEGLASFADYKYTPTRAGRRPFLGDRYTPFADLGWSRVNGQLNYGDLARMGSYADTGCLFSDIYSYALAWAAVFFLDSDSYVEFWKLLGERSTRILRSWARGSSGREGVAGPESAG